MQHRRTNSERRRRLARAALAVGACLLAATSGAAATAGAARDRAVAQLEHTSWTVKDGAPGQVSALVQTTDGFLWLGTNAGLFRFDGVRFSRFEPVDGPPLPYNNVYALHAPPSGGLWVGLIRHGVAFVKDGRVTSYDESDGLPAGTVFDVTTDADGVVWVATESGLGRFDGARWQAVGRGAGYPADTAKCLFVDRDGTLWVSTGETVVSLPRGAAAFRESGAKTEWVGRIAQAPDGALWLAGSQADGAVRRFDPTDASGAATEVRVPSAGILFDRAGSLWIAGLGDGVRRERFPERLAGRSVAKDDPEAEAFTSKDGLTADYVWPALEDREGNVWFGTSAGLDRFRESPVVPAGFPTGSHDFALAAGEGGAVWAGTSNRPLMRMRDGEVTTVAAVPPSVTCAYRAPDGAVWLGGPDGIWRAQGDEVRKVAPLPTTGQPVQAMTVGRDGALWVSILRSPLYRLTPSGWEPFAHPESLPEKIRPAALATDAEGRVWLAHTGSRVSAIEGDAVRVYASEDGLEVGDVYALATDAGGLWAGGDRGVARFDGERFRALVPANGPAFSGVAGIVVASSGDVWVHTVSAITRVPAAEVRRFLDDPSYRVAVDVFDYLDGLPGNATQLRPFPSAVEATDGRLWFATTNGVVWVDPSRIARNPLPPPVAILSVTADGRTLAPDGDLRLPVGTTGVEIDYAGLSLSVPERVRFRYRLDGVDDDWQEAGARRQAFYANLGPGDYRFHVIACNDAGVWNDEGATLAFAIAPAFTQTSAFRAACALAVALGAWAVYRGRVRFVASRLDRQFRDRLRERTRLAQDLHDTLLQGVLSASMQLHVADARIEADSPAKPVVSRVVALMAQVVEEGRGALRGLRASDDGDMPDLDRALELVERELGVEGRFDFRVTVVGRPRALHPLVRDEVYGVAREALVNAFRHSDATTIEAEIEYAPRRLYVAIRDDGRGIDPRVLEEGRDGHFGLSGMRERARAVGARLTIRARERGGTAVELVVPGRAAYRRARPDDRR